jgi:hypothetical protein
MFSSRQHSFVQVVEHRIVDGKATRRGRSLRLDRFCERAKTHTCLKSQVGKVFDQAGLKEVNRVFCLFTTPKHAWHGISGTSHIHASG